MRSAFIWDPTVAKTVQSIDFAIWMAAVPTPLAPA